MRSIQRLVQHLGGDESVTRVAVELGDGSTLTVPHAGALASVPNLPARPITTVWLESAPAAFLASEEASYMNAQNVFVDGGI